MTFQLIVSMSEATYENGMSQRSRPDDQLKRHKTGPHRMAEARPEEMISSQILRSRPGVCC